LPRSYVIYGTMPWDGPWAVDQNVAHALARRHPVLYVDPPLSPASPFRHRGVNWPRLTAVFNRRVRARDRLAVFTPLALPPLSDRHMHAASLPLLREQIRRAVRRAGLTQPILLAYRSLHDLSGACNEALRVGVIMDNVPAGADLLGRDRAELEREVAETCAAADLLCVPSRPVQALLADQGWDSELLPFGFSGDLVQLYDIAAPPHEYQTLPRPLLGYTGGIDDRLDFALIVRIADAFPTGSIVLVGPMSPRLSAGARAALESRPNIHLLGVRPRRMLPSYVTHLDCALLPYIDSEWTRYQSPLKLWEYLYARVPIVATGSLELKRYPPPLVEFAETGDEAVGHVARVLASGSKGCDLRRQFARANTWDARVDELDLLVDRALAQRTSVNAAA
jgi:teichuronic acid biosynthesis glycosyltransferase TuaH